ncbi:MAG: hypothetical protein AAGC93_06640 [Cyanobacteria bacterium P01_F01_bin.53]
MNAAQRPVTPSLQSHPNESLRIPSVDSASEQPASIRQAYRPKRLPYAGARHAIAFESSVKLTVNLLLAIVAATTIAKLVPYYQSQHQRLSTLQSSVEAAEAKNSELRDQFNRNFDPTQASRIMQEQSGRSFPNQKKVIWTAPLDTAPLDNVAQ